ncbi:MAG: DUF21 domain-containing protein [Chitinivibrionales bacterium]|nr:DUF21 domain-containing protein [Chitinivibrionales bacterium]
MLEVPLPYCIIGVLFCFAASTLFSVVKIIFSATDKQAIDAENERLRLYASKIEAIKENRDIMVTTVSTGKTMANTGFILCLLCLLRETLPGVTEIKLLLTGFIFAVIILTVFAYVIPRAIALCYYSSFAIITYRLYSIFSWVLLPLSSIVLGFSRLLLRMFRYDERFAFLTQEEKSRMEGTDADEEALDEEEKEMIHSIFEFGETSVREIMVPRIDIEGLDIKSDYKTTLATIRECGHSRIPVYNENIDTVLGILFAKDIIGWASENSPESWNLSTLIKPALFVPLSKKIDDLMRELKRKHVHMAIVVDEYGGTAGIVTLEDILEEIVGEIQDEYDEDETPIVEISKNIFHVDPHIDLHDLQEEIDYHFDLEDTDYNTLGGLIYHEHGDVPEENTTIEFHGLRIQVLKMDKQKILKVEVEKPPSKNGKSGNGSGD